MELLAIIGVIALIFGVLLLFFPQTIASDEIIIGGRRSMGIILIIAAIYIFYTVFMLAK